MSVPGVASSIAHREGRPVFSNPFWPHPFADPFVLKARGRYYAYGTEDVERPGAGDAVFPVLTSPDLVAWRPLGRAMRALPAPYFRYWAPEVTEHNGHFLLYYAVHTAEFRAIIRVAVADRPEGPFRDSGHDLTGAHFDWAIDPHVLRDDDGTWYLFSTVEFTGPSWSLAGTGNVVDRLLDPFRPEGRPARVVSPQYAWQLFEARRPEKEGLDWYCTEGPAVLRHRRRYYQLYSGGCYHRDNYAISYATAAEPRGPGGLSDRSWDDRSADPGALLVCGRPGALISPGHNSVVLGPNNADLYIAYHAWLPDHSGRMPCLDRLYWHGDHPWTGAPTATPQPVPAQPRLRDSLAGPLSGRWRADGGHWRAGDEATVQDDPAAWASLIHEETLGPAWLLEVNVRHLPAAAPENAPPEGDGAVHAEPRTARQRPVTSGRGTPRGCPSAPTARHPRGVPLRRLPPSGTSRRDDDRAAYGLELACGAGTLTILLRPITRLLTVEDGGTTLARRPLPADCRPDAWHQLLIAGAGDWLDVRLDGLLLGCVRCPRVPDGTFALHTRHCRAAFSAVALTDHFRDEFLEDGADLAGLDWQAPDGGASAWRIGDGWLWQTDPGPSERLLLKGAALGRYEFGATLHLAEHRDAGIGPAAPAAGGEGAPLPAEPRSRTEGSAAGSAGGTPVPGEGGGHTGARRVSACGCRALPAPHPNLGEAAEAPPGTVRAGPALGLVAAHGPEGRITIWLARCHSGWAVQVEFRGAAAHVSATAGLSADFDPAAPHTLRLLRLDSALTVYLDGAHVLDTNAGTCVGRCGLITRAAVAAFTGVWQTGLPAHQHPGATR